MRIACPYCGSRDVDEFTYGGDASRVRPALDDPDMDKWANYVFLRDNPRGSHLEYWQHQLGCREWLIVTRDTATHDISNVEAAHASANDPFRHTSHSRGATATSRTSDT